MYTSTRVVCTTHKFAFLVYFSNSIFTSHFSRYTNATFKEDFDLAEKVLCTNSAIENARRHRIELRRGQYPFSALYRRMNSVIALQYQAPDHMVCVIFLFSTLVARAHVSNRSVESSSDSLLFTISTLPLQFFRVSAAHCLTRMEKQILRLVLLLLPLYRLPQFQLWTVLVYQMRFCLKPQHVVRLYLLFSLVHKLPLNQTSMPILAF
jgi:hypothetical protein